MKRSSRPHPRHSTLHTAILSALAMPALFAAAPALAAVQFSFTSLGTLPGDSISLGYAINASGQVVGASSGSSSQAFLWQAGTMSAVGYGSTAAYGINDSGSIAGVSANQAFVKAPSGAGYGLIGLGGTLSSANAINATGQSVGYATLSGDSVNHATLWPAVGTAFGVRDLGTLGGTNSSALAINASGQVAGVSDMAGGGYHAFVWQSGSMQDLGTLGGSTSIATGINDAGEVVGYGNTAGNAATHAVLWQYGDAQDLGTLGGNYSYASGINASGLVVGYSDTSSGLTHGFVRTGRAGMLDVNALLLPGSVGSVTYATAINADGQIAGTGSVAGQSVAVLLTPTGSVAWQGTGGGGSFNDAVNWEQGFGTSRFLDATISTAGAQTVTESADASVKSLVIGGAAGTSGQPLLVLQYGAAITAANGVTVQATGTLTGDGTIRGNLTNLGTVQANNLSITGAFTNAGLISGSGIVNASLANTATGQVRTGAGQTLQIIGASHSNAGMLDLSGGGTQEYSGALANAAGGRILLNNAILRLDNGLSNAGQVQVSYGGTTVYGAVTTHAGGAVIMSGNSNSTFYDSVDVESGGELRVSQGSTAVFFGPVYQRTGAIFSGTGTKFYEGGLSIGNSPGLGTDAGSVAFGSGNTYLEEIGGVTAGTQFDKYVVAGNLSFGGTLKVVSWNGFSGQSGEHFDVFDWGTSSGTFASIDLSGATLAKGLTWDTSRLYSTGELFITGNALPVPEPETWALMLAGCGVVARATRRRAVRRA